jgi:hypothetical protein
MVFWSSIDNRGFGFTPDFWAASGSANATAATPQTANKDLLDVMNTLLTGTQESGETRTAAGAAKKRCGATPWRFATMYLRSEYLNIGKLTIAHISTIYAPCERPI